MNNRLRVLLTCAVLFVSHAWAEKPWIEVRSEHFRVISNGKPSDVYGIAREFEQIRAVFAMGTANMRLDSGTPLLIFAPKDLQTMGRISSWAKWWQRESVAGYFHPGWEKAFAVVRLDLDRPGVFQPVYHEYVHSVLHMNFRWLPLWLDEGLAELYGTSRFTASSAIVGAPTDRRIVLEHEEPIPLKELFAVDQASPFYHGPKMQLFYAESWALTHYLTFFEGMERGKRLVQFYNSLQGGLDQEKAFEQAFGPVKTVEDNLFKYARHGKMQAWEIKPFAEIPTSTFKLRELPSAELEAELGGLSIWDSRDMANARELIENALKDDPKFALAHENMGFIDFADGKDEDALREFNTAVESDHTRYLSLFYSAMLSPTARSNAPRDEAQFESNLFKILQVNPQFAPVFVQLSLLYARQGDVKKALAAATRATQLEPSRAGYYLLAGRLALQDGRFKDAASVAKYVADRWRGPDHDEALELWSKIPEQQRSTEAPKMDSLPADLKEVEGTVTSVICEKEAQEPTDHKKDEKSGEQKQSKMTLQLRSKDQEMTFHINPDGAQIGFSDILWYGADHFSLCHRVEGMRALVRYKPSSGSNYAGDFTNLEVRVDPVLGSANQRATN